MPSLDDVLENYGLAYGIMPSVIFDTVGWVPACRSLT